MRGGLFRSLMEKGSRRGYHSKGRGPRIPNQRKEVSWVLSVTICTAIIFLSKDPLGKAMLLKLPSLLFPTDKPQASHKDWREEKKKLEFFGGNEFYIWNTLEKCFSAFNWACYPTFYFFPAVFIKAQIEGWGSSLPKWGSGKTGCALLISAWG